MVDCNVGESPPPEPHTATLAEDWVTIWQSEMAGLLLDRELQEALLRLVDGWAAQTRAALAMVPPLDPTQPTRPVPPSRTPAPPPASENDGPERDASMAHLHQRIAELERRLASLEAPVPRR